MRILSIAVALLLPIVTIAQPRPKRITKPIVATEAATMNGDKQAMLIDLDRRFPEYAGISKQIWNLAEVGFHENKSSALLAEQAKKEGFDVEMGVAGMPTAFVATYGSGKPVIGIMAEFDALPGLATEAKPDFTPIDGQKCGHGCGHNLFGAGSLAAAVEIKDWLKKSGNTGTVKLYGCPAEENGDGKVYMVRDGLFIQ